MENTQVLRIENVRATTAIDFKHELENAGLRLNVDFEWKWHNAINQDYCFVEFFFVNPSHATFYKLKWE